MPSRFLTAKLEQLIGVCGEDAYEKIWELACDSTQRAADRLHALTYLTDTLNGRPRQSVEIEQRVNPAEEAVDKIPIEKLEQFLDRLDRGDNDGAGRPN